MVTPACHNHSRSPRIFLEGHIVFRTDRIAGLAQFLGLGCPVCKQIEHVNAAVSPFPAEAHAPLDRRVIFGFISRGRVEPDEHDLR